MSLPKWPEYMAIREVAEYIGTSFRTLEGWKPNGYLPPHIALTPRVHKWRRSEQRGLLDDWLYVRGQYGEIDGWAVMRKRLKAAQAKTAAVAQEVA